MSRAPIFGSYWPIEELFTPGPRNTLFRNESAARWFLRTHRPELVDAEAIVIHTGRMFFDPAKLEPVALKVALGNVRGDGFGRNKTRGGK